MADVNIDPQAAEMYFSAHYAPGGYAWIIPLGQDMANVGVGVRASYLAGQKLPLILDRFIREHTIAAEKLAGGEVLAVMRGLVPAGGTVGAIQKGNMLLAGDAAGHVMATSGGGIPLAVVAGRIAGEVAIGQLQGKMPLADYPSRIREEFGIELIAIGSDQEDGGYGHEERPAHECPLCRPQPCTDEISNARSDPGAARISRMGPRRIRIKASN